MQIKLISAGAGLLGFGALVGWAITADHYEHRIKLLREHDEITIAHLRDVTHFLNNKNVMLENEKALWELDIPKEAVTSESDVTDESPEISEAEERATRNELQTLINEYTGDPMTSGNFVDTSMTALKVDRTPPFVISRETYAWDEDEGDNYSKITLTYYKRHRVLLDEDDELIDDVGSLVGWKNLNQFGFESGDPNVVFIRNRLLLSDFEVILDEENEIPTHIKYGMGRDEFNTGKAAGIIKLRPEDRD